MVSLSTTVTRMCGFFNAITAAVGPPAKVWKISIFAFRADHLSMERGSRELFGSGWREHGVHDQEEKEVRIPT